MDLTADHIGPVLVALSFLGLIISKHPEQGGGMQRLTDQQLIAKLREKPYSRVCREAADRLEALLREKAAHIERPSASSPGSRGRG